MSYFSITRHRCDTATLTPGDTRRRIDRLSRCGAVIFGVLSGGTALAQVDVPGREVDEAAGLRTRIAEHGLTFDVDIVADYSMVLSGGAEPRGIADRLLAQAGVTLDTEKALGWPGGQVFITYQGFHGDDGSLDSGDAQVYSNIDATAFDALYSVYYEQRLIDDQLDIKLGKMDANADFAYVNNGAAFIHSSPGFSPTILSFPSYPDPSTAVNMFWHDRRGPYLGAGVYDGATQDGIATGTRGPATFFGPPDATFYIAEAGAVYDFAGHPGRLGIGAWHHTGIFERFDASEADHASGTYVVLDQTLYSAARSPRQLEGFAQYGRVNGAVSPFSDHVGAGVTLSAPSTDRPDDAVGLMASYVVFSDAPGTDFKADYELAIEAFYAVQLGPILRLKPDLQYIANPGGRGLANATVGTLRLEASF